MAANELEEVLTWFIGYPRQDDVTGNFDDTIKKLESLIESEKVKAVEEYRQELNAYWPEGSEEPTLNTADISKILAWAERTTQLGKELESKEEA